jgi:predicted nucleic acid-binding protein
MDANGPGRNSTVLKTFLDTNILVYSVDAHDEKKQNIARLILKYLKENGYPVVSTQVLQEFYNAATKKLEYDPATAKVMMHDFANMELIQNSLATIENGIDISITSNIAFWDGLIIAAAETAKCSSVFSEDLNHGQIIHGVKIVNPFLATLPQ